MTTAPRSYTQSFQGWSFIDVPLPAAERLIAELVAAGAGFAHTSEPGGEHRRIYFFSETSTEIVKGEHWLPDPPHERRSAMIDDQ